MKEARIGEIFSRTYKGAKNFMTPNLVKYGQTGNGYIYEVSSGRGITEEKIYGVTVLTVGGEKTEKNTCCFSLTEVENVISAI